MPDLFLIDPASAAIVLGGTAIATLARAGWANACVTAQAVAGLAAPRFDHDAMRAALAAEVRSIRQNGLLRAQPVAVSDRALADCTTALAQGRSLDALMERHAAHRTRRSDRRARALTTLEQAAELGPVFGLIGTLIGLGQLPAAGLGGGEGAVMAAVATAILTTLYGLLTAHLLILPLAGAIERRAQAEEHDRDRLIDWLAHQIAPACRSTAMPAPASIAA